MLIGSFERLRLREVRVGLDRIEACPEKRRPKVASFPPVVPPQCYRAAFKDVAHTTKQLSLTT